MFPERLRYIAIKGPIGVGKTSLAKRLARLLNTDLLLEHPFLPRSYTTRSAMSWPPRLFYLLALIYSEFFYHYDNAPLLIENSEGLGFVDQEHDFMLLVERICTMRGYA